MNDALFQRRLSLVRASVLVLNPVLEKIHKEQLEFTISKASSTDGVLIFNELEKLVLKIAKHHGKSDIVTAILGVD